MTGFHVQPDALDAQAGRVGAIGGDVGSGAAAEVAGTAQADFGVLVGAIIGPGIRELAGSYEQALRATSGALRATGDQLRATARTYRQAEDENAAELTGSGGGP
jgi:hypothetical protein